MVFQTEHVKILIETIVKGKDDLKTQEKALRDIAREAGIAGKQFNAQSKAMVKNAVFVQNMKAQYDSFGGVMSMGIENWQQFNKGMGRFNTVGGRMANRVRMLVHGMRGFRMELLGVMFFGMSVQRLFTGLLRPALEVFGVFDLWQSMLTILFLPAGEKVMNWMIKLFDWFSQLSPEAKSAISEIALLGVAVGTVLMVAGTMGLGVGSLILFAKEINKLFPDAITHLKGMNGILTKVAGVGLITIGIKLGFDALMKEGIDLWYDIAVAILLTLGLKWLRVPGLGKATFGAVFSLMFGLDMAFDSFAKPGLQIWQDIIAAIGIYLGLIALVPSAAGLATFSLVATLVIGFDLLFSKFEGIEKFRKDVGDAIRNAVMKEGLFSKLFNIGSDSTGGSAGPLGGSGPKYNDFMFRPGQKPVSFSPNDTIVGFKGGGGPGGATVNQTLNIQVSDSYEIERLIDENNKTLVNDLSRMSTLGG